MSKHLLPVLLVAACLASDPTQQCSGDSCNVYAATEVAELDATREASLQLLQRKSSESSEEEETDADDTTDEDVVEADFDYEEDDIDVDDAGLQSAKDKQRDQCDALDKKYPELVKVDFDLADNTVSNLGGVGPDSDKEEMLYYKKAATADDGETYYDLKVTVVGNSYKSITPQINGLKGHYGIINVACGTSVDVKFELLDPNSGKAATLKNLIFSWFDLDKGKVGGGLESVTLWQGYDQYVVSSSSEIKEDDVDCPGGDGECKRFSATTWGVGKDNPEDPLTLTKQQAARTFATYYKDVSSFQVTLTAGDGFGSRNFLFTGMSQVAYGSVEECCPDHICGCQESCSANDDNWGEKCENAKCADCSQCVDTTTTTTQAPASKSETCSNGVTFELSEDRLAENTLGKKKNGRLLFKNVVQNNGRAVDLSITDAAGAQRYGGKGYQPFAPDQRDYTGAYKNAGRIAFENAGNYVLRFTMLDSETGEPVKLPLFPFALYDIDGRGEIVQACNVAAVIKHEPDGLRERIDGRCYNHISSGHEVNTPRDFESLTVNQKKHAVTYVYKNTASWDLGVILGKQEEQRYILFKSSKVLACDYESKARDDAWNNEKPKKSDA